MDEGDGEESDYGDTLPRYFDFTGKIIFISNLPLDKLDPDGALRHTACIGPASSVRRIPQRTHDAGGREGGPFAGDHDDSTDPLHSACAVHRNFGSGSLLDLGCLLRHAR